MSVNLAFFSVHIHSEALGTASRTKRFYLVFVAVTVAETTTTTAAAAAAAAATTTTTTAPLLAAASVVFQSLFFFPRFPVVQTSFP